MVRDLSGSSKSISSIASPLVILRRKLIALTALFSAITIVGGWGLSLLWSPLYGLRWAVLSLSVLAYQTALLWRALPKNRGLGTQPILPDFGIGNLLTIARGVFVSWLAGFLFSPLPDGMLAWLPASLYLVADILDYFDGFAARITGLSTELGGYWDQELDSLGVVIAPLLAVSYGQLPIWVLLVSASRYLFVLGIWWRKFNHKPVFDLPPSTYRRAFAGFQMGFFGFALLPIFSRASTWVSASVFMIPFMLGFLRDWLVVSGVINAAQERYHQMVRIVTSFGMKVLPVGLRIVVVFFGVGYGLMHIAGLPLTLFPGRVSPVQILGSLEVLLALLVGLGVGGRVVSLILLLLTGLFLDSQELGVFALVVGTSYMTVLGTGAFSIWQPEQEFVRRRYGGAESG